MASSSPSQRIDAKNRGKKTVLPDPPIRSHTCEPFRRIEAGTQLSNGRLGDPADAGQPVQLGVDLRRAATRAPHEKAHDLGVAFTEPLLFLTTSPGGRPTEIDAEFPR